MPHVFEPAPTGRARCRGCGRAIARGELRFGEQLPNPFADDREMTLWFHPLCAAFKRPEPLLAALAEAPPDVPDRARLEQTARKASAHRRLPRIDGAERAPTAQAGCRSCRERIERGAWRIRLVYFDDGRFAPAGFVHLRCAEGYFETDDVIDPLLHFSPELSADEREQLRRDAQAPR